MFNLTVVNTSEVAMECGRIYKSYATINKIYRDHTIGGRRLVQESYIRNSSRDEKQSNYDANANFHPIALPKSLQVHNESQGNREFVPMTEILKGKWGGTQEPYLCLYQIKGEENVTIPQLTSLVYRLVEKRATMIRPYRCVPERMPRPDEWSAQVQALVPFEAPFGFSPTQIYV